MLVSQNLKKLIALVLLIILAGLPAFHKLFGEFPPTWFMDKFSSSAIDLFPAGLEISYAIIILMEVIGPGLIIVGLVRGELKSEFWLISTGILVYYLLFLTLSFGSFLVEDYNNGFKDFMYFVGIFLLDHFLLSESPETT